MRRIKGVIFDLDGTVLDSMKIWEDVDKTFLKENNISPPEGISDIVKKLTIELSADYFIKEFELPYSQQEVIDRIEQIVRDKYAHSIGLRDGVIELLDLLDRNGVPYCIATATYLTLAEAALERLGIFDRFKFILTCSDIGSAKTSPEIFIEAATRMNCTPSETAVIEDSLHCIETAVKGGFYTIGVYEETSASDWEKIREMSNLAVESLSGLAEVLKC